MTPAAAGWDDYLARFHDDEAGITEDLLGRTSDDGTDPYTWCAEPLRSRSGTVLDLAGGSGPMADHLGPAWVGVDTARGELAVARAAGRTALAQGSATQLPVPDAAVSTVVCTMSLQVIAPLTDALVEADRVLDEQGRLVLLLPASRPLGWRDGWTYLRLQVALRAVIRYPNGAALSPRRLARRAPATAWPSPPTSAAPSPCPSPTPTPPGCWSAPSTCPERPRSAGNGPARSSRPGSATASASPSAGWCSTGPEALRAQRRPGLPRVDRHPPPGGPP